MGVRIDAGVQRSDAGWLGHTVMQILTRGTQFKQTSHFFYSNSES